MCTVIRPVEIPTRRFYSSLLAVIYTDNLFTCPLLNTVVLGVFQTKSFAKHARRELGKVLSRSLGRMRGAAAGR